MLNEWVETLNSQYDDSQSNTLNASCFLESTTLRIDGSESEVLWKINKDQNLISARDHRTILFVSVLHLGLIILTGLQWNDLLEQDTNNSHQAKAQRREIMINNTYDHNLWSIILQDLL